MLLDAAAAAPAALSVQHVAHLLIFSGVASSFAPFGCFHRPLSTPLYLSLPPSVTFLLIFLCPTFLALFSSILFSVCLIFYYFFPFFFFFFFFFFSLYFLVSFSISLSGLRHQSSTGCNTARKRRWGGRGLEGEEEEEEGGI